MFTTAFKQFCALYFSIAIEIKEIMKTNNYHMSNTARGSASNKNHQFCVGCVTIMILIVFNSFNSFNWTFVDCFLCWGSIDHPCARYQISVHIFSDTVLQYFSIPGRYKAKRRHELQRVVSILSVVSSVSGGSKFLASSIYRLVVEYLNRVWLENRPEKTEW